ncbi:MAG: DnaA/Hda family protein [Anaerovoracaceae bacterium]|nr:DnaA/Hda family protein [Anaerovoracaceae bacterium]
MKGEEMMEHTVNGKAADFYTAQANRAAYALVRLTAETLYAPCGPVYLYGDAGLGKTHLLQAAEDFALKKYDDCVVQFFSAEDFVCRLNAALVMNKIHTLENRLLSSDLLLVDDIQALSGLDHAQKELSKIIRYVGETNTPVILTGNLPVRQMQGMDEDFINLMEGGVAMEVKPMDFPDRLNLLAQVAEKAGLAVGSEREVQDAILYITDISGADIGAMKSALHRVHMFAEILDEALTVDFARKVLAQ